MTQRSRFAGFVLVAGLLAAAVVAGCSNGEWRWPGTSPTTGSAGASAVPRPLDALLPRQIRIHPFTGTRVFDPDGGVTGIDVRIEAIDGYGDANKAFGTFRFELFRHRPNSPDQKGNRLEVWQVNVEDIDSNKDHWNHFTCTYQFKLQWGQSIPVGKKFVLLVVFESSFTPRMFDERVFVAGQ